MAAEIASATPLLAAMPNVLWRMSAIAGCASAPMPIEVIVTPIWTAEMYSLTFPSWCSASAAPFAPSSRSSSSRARLERTSAYSAITKKAFSAISSAAMISLSPFTRSLRPSARPRAGSALRRAGASVSRAAHQGHATSGKFFVVGHRACRPLKGSKGQRRKPAGGSAFRQGDRCARRAGSRRRSRRPRSACSA